MPPPEESENESRRILIASRVERLRLDQAVCGAITGR